MKDLQLLRAKQVFAKMGISKAAFYNRISNGLFPTGIQISAKSVVWSNTEVDAVIKAMITGKSGGAMKAFVADLVAARGDI